MVKIKLVINEKKNHLLPFSEQSSNLSINVICFDEDKWTEDQIHIISQSIISFHSA
jgi:hypothetical protein